MWGIKRRVRGIKEEAKGVASRAAYQVASTIEATFPGRRRGGQIPPNHRKVASFSRGWRPSPGNSGPNSEQDRPNSAKFLALARSHPHELPVLGQIPQIGRDEGGHQPGQVQPLAPESEE